MGAQETNQPTNQPCASRHPSCVIYRIKAAWSILQHTPFTTFQLLGAYHYVDRSNTHIGVIYGKSRNVMNAHTHYNISAHHNYLLCSSALINNPSNTQDFKLCYKTVYVYLILFYIKILITLCLVLTIEYNNIIEPT